MEHDLWRQWQSLTGPATPPEFAFPPSVQAGFAPFIDAATRFAGAARTFAEGSRNSAAPGATAAAAEAFGNFLRDQFAGSLKAPWAGILSGASSYAPPFAAEAPALGLTREHQERAQRAAEAAQRMADAQQRLTRMWFDTLREAAAAFAARLAAPVSPALDAEELNRLYDTWIDCAEDAYARTAHSDAFCDALADYVNAGSSWRRESNAGVEQWAKMLDLPTRHEINTLAQRLRSVEEELRSMRVGREAKPR